MKSKILFSAATAAIAGALTAPPAHAVIRDPLTGPAAPGATTTVQSPLTSATNNAQQANPFISGTRSNGFGNSRFGAGYSLYSYTGSPSPTQTQGYQSVSISARAFGRGVNLLDAYMYGLAHGANRTATVTHGIFVVGNQVRAGTRGGGDFRGLFNISNMNQHLWSSAGPNNSGTEVFSFAGASIRASAALRGGMFQDITGRVWYDGVNATLSQSVKVDASGQVAALLFGNGAGVRLNDLVLIEARFGLNSKAAYSSFSPAPNACVSFFHLGATHSLNLKELSGNIEFFVTSWFGGDSWRIAEWSGFRQDFTFLNVPVTTRQYGSCLGPIPAAPVFTGIIVS